MKKQAALITRQSVHNRLVHYVFNPKHKIGWPKGQWFIRVLGFDPDKPEHISVLAKQIFFDTNTAVFNRNTAWGLRLEQDLTISGPNGKTIDGITAIWQRDVGSGIIKLLTILPPEQ